MRRRDFIKGVASSAGAWPLAVRAQQSKVPTVVVVSPRSSSDGSDVAAAFRNGLSESGYAEDQNVTVEYHWLEGRYDSLQSLMADIVRRRVAVIAIPGSNPATLAAKAATATIPIVFGVGQDPVKLGLVKNLARPGGNATGVNFFVQEVTVKRLGILHELLPKAVRIALLVNPGNASSAESILQEIPEAARTLGLQFQVFRATSSAEIDTTFAAFDRERPDALFVAADGFFSTRRVQFATLAAIRKLPTSYAVRDMVDAGGLMSYGASLTDMYRQVGIYTGQILKGEQPANLPVLQTTKLEFVLNLQTAKAFGIEVPPTLLARADAVIE
jgi:putative tryptophan/tyrosine transport system substrate-binding protein